MPWFWKAMTLWCALWLTYLIATGTETVYIVWNGINLVVSLVFLVRTRRDLL